MQRSYKTQHHNFRKTEIVQIRENDEWRNYTLPCTLKLAIDLALKAEQIYGYTNVRIIASK